MGENDTNQDDPYPSSRGRQYSTFSSRKRLFPEVPDELWNDWKWQFRNRITTLAELERHFPLAEADRAKVRDVLHEFRLGITPYYLSLIDPDDPADPLYRQAVPTVEEFLNLNVGEDDPLAEDDFSPVPGITHRYPDRCLLVATNSCALYCRYCTRKRIMEEGESPLPKSALDAMIDYIARTPQIRDVIVSGGDPLTWSTARLEEVISRLRAIPHVEIIRIGSRVPVTLPQRITPELCAMLEKYYPLWINTHFNHPREITKEAALACERLLRAGIPVNNQAVLLRGVNDTPETMRELVHLLMRIRVRPYYLYHCDPVKGAAHFRTSVKRGLEIIESLRGHTSGLAIPHYVIDAPGGGGKVPLLPNYLLAYQNGRAIIRNFKGQIFEYDDPPDYDDAAVKPHPKLFYPKPQKAAVGANGNGNGNGNGHANGNGNGNGKVNGAADGNGNGNGNGAAHASHRHSWGIGAQSATGLRPDLKKLLVLPANGNGNGNGHGNGNGNGNGNGHCT